MSSTDFEDFVSCGFLVACIGLVFLALDRFGGPAGKMLIACIFCLLTVGATVVAWRVNWRIAIPFGFILASLCARELIIAGQAAMPLGGQYVPGYPWYLTSAAYYGICIALFGSGITFAAMVVLGREPEWMRELLD